MSLTWQKENPQALDTQRLAGGAGNVTRTHDLLITNQLLYRLSYTSKFKSLEPRHNADC